MIQLDTNILLRSKDINSQEYPFVIQKISQLISDGNVLVISPQNLYEFYAVATRPTRANGFGMDENAVMEEIENLTETYLLLPETQDIFYHWKELAKKYAVKGKTTHDTRLVAFMLSHQIEKLYTLNVSDFVRYQDIIELV